MSVDAVTLCLALSLDKVMSIRRECRGLIIKPSYNSAAISTSLKGHFSSSIQAVFPAPLYYRYLQQAKIQVLRS